MTGVKLFLNAGGGATARRGDGTGRAIVDLYEYQGRDLFERHGLPVLAGGVATTPEEARAIAERLGGRVVVKAQVKVGGRGKAGGVKLAEGPDEAVARATDILGMDIKGHTVHKVMITVTADVAEEYYFSYLLDRANRTFLCIASVAGGMDIEQVAAETPDQVVKAPIDAVKGVDEAKAREIVTAAGFPAEVADQVVEVAVGLWQAFVAEDATLVEVNPLAKNGDGQLLLLDAKITLDENAGVPAPGPRGAGRPGRRGPAGAGRQGQGPQLRQARRRGRHHRQRRGSGHVDPRRRRVRR